MLDNDIDLKIEKKLYINFIKILFFYIYFFD
jgi:hypothetical protein